MRTRRFRKIAVLKPSALGDFIFSLPALIALRETYPDAEVVYLGKKWHHDFLSHRKSLIDRIIIVPPYRGVGENEDYTNDESVLASFFTRMQEENFDLAVQLHGGGRFSNNFVLRLEAGETIGTHTPDAAPLDKSIRYEYYQSEYLRWLEVVSLVNAKTTTIHPILTATREEIHEARVSLEGEDTAYIVLHPGATDLRRRWSAEQFATVGDHFAKKGYRILITGSNDEKGTVENVINSMNSPADNFYEKVTINGLVGLLSSATLVISNDTGPLHLADALSTKTVGLYWCGNMINAAPPKRNTSITLSSWIVHCPLCGVNCAQLFPFKKEASCSHETSFVKDITVNEVINSAEYLLSSSNHF